VQSDLVSLVTERLRCGPAQAVVLTGDEHASHQSPCHNNVLRGMQLAVRQSVRSLQALRDRASVRGTVVTPSRGRSSGTPKRR